MKTRTIKALALLVTLTAICASCEKTTGPAVKGGGVLFSGGIGRSESGSKTAYAGHTTGTESEGINWTTGDKVRIWCAECSEPTTDTYGKNDHFADYTVTSGATPAGSLTVEPNTVGLRWGDAGTTHHFYAVYPSPKTTDKGDEGKFGTNPSSFTFTGHIPATQGIASYTSGDLSVASPDMSSLYMVTKGTEARPESDGGEVFLQFTPLSTAIEFTITNGLSDDKVMNVESVSLKSAGHKLCGAFVVDQSGTWARPVSKKYSGTHSAIYTYANDYPNCAEPAGESGQGNEVTINLANTAACTSGIANGKTLRFTFFLLPLTPSEDGTVDDVDDLYLTIKRTDKSLKTKLSMANGAPIPFPTHKKTYITGIIVPDGAGESLNFTATVAEWGAGEDLTAELETEELKKYVEIPAKYDGSTTTTLKWYRQNLAISESGKRSWKGGNDSAVKVPGTVEDVIVGDYFQWAAHENYVTEENNDKGLLIYTEFTNRGCGDASDGFTFKSAPGGTYQFNTSSSGSSISISPYHDGSYTHYDKDHLCLDRTGQYTGNNDDVANIILGGTWRMPTSEEFQAMKDATYWKWDATDIGYYVYEPNPASDAGKVNNNGTGTYDKSDALLFVPSTGYGFLASLMYARSSGIFWSSTLNSGDVTSAYNMDCTKSSGVRPQTSNSRCNGFTVRPVSD